MTSSFANSYAERFTAYLGAPRDEGTLHAAYELGREAVQDGLSVLDLAMAHHAALRMALPGAPIEATLRAAEDFFLESVAAFEMVQRGFREAQDSAALQRRHAEMLRQLSDFLADASLALHASESVDEMLRLVCEQARELVPAALCMVTIGDGPQARLRAASYQEDDLALKALVTWSDLSAPDRAVRDFPGVLRIPAGAASKLLGPAGVHPGRSAQLGEWLGVALRALDGRRLGAIHLVGPTSERFSALDEAVISHLGQMAAAAVERALLYVRDPPPGPSSGPRSA